MDEKKSFVKKLWNKKSKFKNLRKIKKKPFEEGKVQLRIYLKKCTPTLISIEKNSLSNFYYRFMSDKKFKKKKSPVGDKKFHFFPLKCGFCGCFRTQLMWEVILKFNF